MKVTARATRSKRVSWAVMKSIMTWSSRSQCLSSCFIMSTRPPFLQRRPAPVTQTELDQQLGYPRQMVVIMLGHEERMIHQAHWYAQAGMRRGVRQCRIFDGLEPADQRSSSLAEAAQDHPERCGIMVGLVGPAIRQVGRAHLWPPGQQVFYPRTPQRFEVQQVPRVFLSGPRAARTARENGYRQGVESIFQAGRGAAEAFDDDWAEIHRQACGKSPLEPGLSAYHVKEGS